MAQGQRQPGFVFPTVLVSVLAALGIGVSMQRSASGPAAHTGDAAAGGQPAKAGNSASKTALGMLEDFLAVSALDSPAGRPSIGDEANGKFGPGDARARYRVRFLIETVPVPISSPLRASFDGDMDAITAAANDADFTLDRFDLPWTEAGREKPPAPQLPSEVDVFSGKAAPLESPLFMYKAKPDTGPRWLREPGMVLFRGIRKENAQKDRPLNEERLLLVFLVGETPTRGIDAAAMRNALDQIAGMWNSPDDQHLRMVMGDPRTTLRQLDLVGPRFSGSAPSIRNELESWLTSNSARGLTNLNIRIFSGAASDLKLQDVEPRGCSIEPNAPSPQQWQAPRLRCRITFTNLLVTDDERWRLIVPALRHGIFNTAVQYSQSRGMASPGPNDIALLMEDTPYGRLPRWRPQVTAMREKIPGLVRLPYPLQISHLRTAFAAGKQVQSEIAFSLGPPEVPAVDEGDSGRQDVIPSFSTRSPGYEQLVLAGLLKRIQREHIRYVGIQSTDIADLIFLVSQLRQYSPDSLLFTISSDLWFLRSDLNPDLYGLLVFSTYPLRSENQLWTLPSKKDLSRQFESEAAEGIFNATLMALDRKCDMLEQGTPFVTFPLKTGEVCAASFAHPILWTGVVGHEQIWPLYFQEPELPSPPPNRDFLKESGCMDYPSTFVCGFIALLSFSLIIAIAILSPLYSGAGGTVGRWLTLHTPSWAARNGAVTDDSGLRYAAARRRLYVTSLSIGLLTAVLIGAAYFWLPILRIGCSITPSAPFWTMAVQYLVLALAVLTLIALLGAIAVSIATPGTTSPSDPPVRGFSVFLVFLSLILSVWFLFQLWKLPPGFVPLVFLRSTVLGSGVSPLTPLIYLGVAALALNVCHLRQLSLLGDSGLPANGFLGLEGDSFEGACAREKAVVRLLGAGPLELPGAYFLLALIAVQGVYYLVTTDFFRDALDGRAFGMFYVLSTLIVYGGLFFLLLRFIAVWGNLHKLLDRLFFHPTRAAYESFRTKRYPSSDGSPVRLLEPAHSMIQVEYCLERARELLKLAHDEDSVLAASVRAADLPDRIRTCEEWLHQVHQAVTAADWKKAAAADLELQGKMAALSGVLTKLFDPVWRLGKEAQPPGAVAGSSKEHELADQAELFIASRVLDFLRRIYVQILNLAQFAVIGIVAVMLASSTYPMPAPDTGLWLAWGALLSAVGITMYVFVRMNMNRVISMLQGSTPGYFNLNSSFAIQLTFFALLPILTMLGAHFPHALDGFFSWAGGRFSSVH